LKGISDPSRVFATDFTSQTDNETIHLSSK